MFYGIFGALCYMQPLRGYPFYVTYAVCESHLSGGMCGLFSMGSSLIMSQTIYRRILNLAMSSLARSLWYQ